MRRLCALLATLVRTLEDEYCCRRVVLTSHPTSHGGNLNWLCPFWHSNAGPSGRKAHVHHPNTIIPPEVLQIDGKLKLARSFSSHEPWFYWIETPSASPNTWKPSRCRRGRSEDGVRL
ncbi:uncharacterized protein LOC126483713 [Schistocerca serialis cubense]|uniref:uncharacterized protein LOC126483713 n=1 Tax=Schistocerca serialis cubense TaxID=2023355 RepID=UPI00214F3C8F|nr:uncharacterized protein LOC126483713 [Schistocerca serialis cubense]